MHDDEKWMQEALLEAKRAALEDEVPVGAVFVVDNELVARAHNEVEARGFAGAHAEFLCLERAAAHCGNWRLKGTLYTTLEPCSMCLGAILLSRVERLVWGAPDLRHGALGSWQNLLEKDHPTHELESVGGVLAEESAALLKKFFQEKRKEK